MRRREFIAFIAGGAAGWPLGSHAQQANKTPRVGFLGSASAASYKTQVQGFQQGLHEFGYVDGQNIRIEYRWAEGDQQRLQEHAADLGPRPITRLASV